MLDKNDPASEVRFQQQHRFPLDGVGRPDSNLQDQGTPSLVVVTHFEVRVGVEEPRAKQGSMVASVVVVTPVLHLL